MLFAFVPLRMLTSYSRADGQVFNGVTGMKVPLVLIKYRYIVKSELYVQRREKLIVVLCLQR